MRDDQQTSAHPRLTSLPDVLVVGRAVHPPWNEGTRLIAHATARAAALHAHVRTVSVTNEAYRDAAGAAPNTSHVLTGLGYGTLGDYATLPRLIRRIRHLTRDRQPAVTHLVGAPMSLAPWLRGWGSRVVAHVTLTRQAYLPLADRVRATLAWRLFGRWVDAYACSSPAVRDDLLAKGLPEDRLYVVPPSIDLATYAGGDRQADRAALGWPDGAFVVAYIGTVSPKRFPAELVMSAIDRARRSVPNVVVEVFPPLATHGYNVDWLRDNVEAAAAGADVPTRVHLGDLEPDAKAQIYRAADAVLFPFAAPVAVEPPLTLLEAMACEAIVLAAPAANRSHIVTSGNGVEWSTEDDLAAAIARVASLDSVERERLGRAARERIEHEHSVEAVEGRLLDLWSDIGVALPTRIAPRRGSGRRGLTVAVVGADGAGKSAVVASLAGLDDLAAVRIYMGVDRPKATHALPTTRWLLERRTRRAAATGLATQPPAHERRTLRRRVRTALHDAAALPHELLEFGYRYLVGRRVRRDRGVALFDRYVYDALVDAQVDGVGGLRRFRAKLFARVFPPPDLMVVLEAPGSVLFERKGEHSPARLDAVTAAHLRLAGRARRMLRVDASRPLAAVVSDIAQVIREEAGLPERDGPVDGTGRDAAASAA